MIKEYSIDPFPSMLYQLLLEQFFFIRDHILINYLTFIFVLGSSSFAVISMCIFTMFLLLLSIFFICWHNAIAYRGFFSQMLSIKWWRVCLKWIWLLRIKINSIWCWDGDRCWDVWCDGDLSLPRRILRFLYWNVLPFHLLIERIAYCAASSTIFFWCDILNWFQMNLVSTMFFWMWNIK